MKLINDPVYGLIHIRTPLIFDIIEQPLFQRLRRIKQTGLTHLVYPGAQHTRFHHALGAMHLMGMAIDELRIRQTDISPLEEEAVLIAVLLHDIGHSPYSHALERLIIEADHESIGKAIIAHLAKEFGKPLELALEMFTNKYNRPFFHQLISGQLDLDRLDYLSRDSFYTGVAEGVVGHDRILRMLRVIDDQLVVEEKGIYSIGRFVIFRRCWSGLQLIVTFRTSLVNRKLCIRSARPHVPCPKNNITFVNSYKFPSLSEYTMRNTMV